MFHRRFLLTTLSLALLPLFGLGCNPFQRAQENFVERTIESQVGGDVNINTEKNTIEIKDTDSGETINMAGEGGSVQIPADFPNDVPVYANAQVKLVMGSKEQQTSSVTFEVADGLDAVMGWYTTQLREKGWTESSSMDLGTSKVRMYTKTGARLQLTMSKNEENQKTFVQLVRSKE